MIKPRFIRKLPECPSCRFYADDPFELCDIFPAGINEKTCPHFAADPVYYNGELIKQTQQCLTTEEKLALLDTHPLFTGKCPECGHQFLSDFTLIKDWVCPDCGHSEKSK